jgi:hypothetical protein
MPQLPRLVFLLQHLEKQNDLVVLKSMIQRHPFSLMAWLCYFGGLHIIHSLTDHCHPRLRCACLPQHRPLHPESLLKHVLALVPLFPIFATVVLFEPLKHLNLLGEEFLVIPEPFTVQIFELLLDEIQLGQGLISLISMRLCWLLKGILWLTWTVLGTYSCLG